MGGGIKRSTDAGKGQVFDLLAAIVERGASGRGPQAGEAAEFCAREHGVSFRTAAEAKLSVGQQVQLSLATPPNVISGGRVIGQLTGKDATAMRGCLVLDYELAGVVASFSPATGIGALTISGARREAA
jgi:hypothetical protein